ncbi:hypothetical protein ABZP36_002166 [Zizania latifolia]
MSLFFTTLQAQGQQEGFVEMDYVPVQTPEMAAMQQQMAVLPNQQYMGNVCKECTCCNRGNTSDCTLMYCCTQRACNIPGTPPNTCGNYKFTKCSCNNCS